jgi:hypothetical protein
VAGGSRLSIPAHIVPVSGSVPQKGRRAGHAAQLWNKRRKTQIGPGEVAEVVEKEVKFGSSKARKPLPKYGNNPYNNPELQGG